MLLYRMKFEVKTIYGYQPDDCKTGIITDVYWNKEKNRMVLELTYDNGAIDWIPLSDIENKDYIITNK